MTETSKSGSDTNINVSVGADAEAPVISVNVSPAQTVVNLGIFEDGTDADWTDDVKLQTAVQRLSRRYLGLKEYKGGPGTDERGWWSKLKETLTGAGRADRFEDLREAIKLHKPDEPGTVMVVDLFGWSRGADEMIEFVDECLKLGVAVRFLGVFDPVPARGMRAFKRIIPFLPLPRHYPRPNVGSVCQVLAGDEHSRLLRHARIELDEKRDYELSIPGADHGESGRGPRAEKFMETSAAIAGVAWKPATLQPS
jgi:hypothetical protein